MEGFYKNGRAKQMKKSFLMVLLFTLCLLVSCSVTNYVIKKNRYLTNKEVELLFQKNGNAFYLSSTYSYFSFVWSYNEDSVEILRLRKGIIKQKQVFKEKENIQYAGFSLEDIETELYQKCALELDGDEFGYIIDYNGKRFKADFAVNINCLKQQKYNSVFLNKIINDINYYNIWDYK